MKYQQSFREHIKPIPLGESRPLWSVMIPTYNCANFLRETLASVLVQDPGPEVMQIQVVDDYSTKDDPEAVVKELGGDRVEFYCQPENVRYIRNFNTCIQRARGKIIHILHGDDYVLNGFYKKMELLFAQHPDIGAAFCRQIYMDNQGYWHSFSPLEQFESGVLSNWLERIASEQRITTPSIVVRRDVYERLGGFDSRFTCTGEDWEMWVRIATTYPVAYEVQPLAVYRQSTLGSLTQTSMRTGKFFQDLRKADEIIQSYLPNYIQETIARKASKRARETYASWAISSSYQIFTRTGNVRDSLIPVKEALQFGCSSRVIMQLSRLFMKTITYKLKEKLIFFER
ncbi:glycosyltransferase family 2 protein [Calothrix sp. NIES-3974]|uniref:glycosyltransferase family 2 protein n=1 Tax=Calothrix sp. NIES-3974 TaxID=2005462 RepID=UPI000B5EF3E8|nr:glycosyltransferase family A protein [Calothrix sp. NIES-3974]BAZ03874.1 family 2 glycosyl transferase [Calothrix sp. NIES-3974]